MKSLNDYMETYKKEIRKGDIRHAYTGIMAFFKRLKTHFQYECASFSVKSNIYTGCMDLTFISFSTELLKREKLKIAIVFLHDECRFDIWLTGVNKQHQEYFLQLLRKSHWHKYPLALSIKEDPYISSSILVKEPDFNDLERLTKTLEGEVLAFIDSIEAFISSQ